jgi:hypothetical protein
MINQPTLNQRIKAQQAEQSANPDLAALYANLAPVTSIFEQAKRRRDQTNPPRQPLTPRGCYSITEAAAHSMIAGEVLRWLDQIPHYYDTEYYLDRHDLDRVLEVIRRLGRRGLLKLDNAVGVNAD